GCASTATQPSPRPGGTWATCGPSAIRCWPGSSSCSARAADAQRVSAADWPKQRTGGTKDVGTSYQNLMVVGDLADVVGAMNDLGADAWVLPAAAVGRVAVLPRENEHNYADADELARAVSAKLRTDALSNVVFDSDVVLINVYRNGECVHEYVSEQAMLVDWF